MYTRTYQSEEGKITVPENYDGNAFREERECESLTSSDISTAQFTEAEAKTDNIEERLSKSVETAAECKAAPAKKAADGGIFASIFKSGRASTFFDSLPFIKNGRFEIGTEEILIAAVALFLLFSKSGDKECAIMLLLLLFVK